MFKAFIKQLVKKYGAKKLIILVGDLAVSLTPNKADDKIWAKVKKELGKLSV